jgi:general nucleoside transport system ATP-binding protein
LDLSAEPSSNTPAVELFGLSKRFGALQAVQSVDLALRSGEIHALLGENGAGKTTLMCMLAGLYRPDAGHIEVGGQPTSFRSPRDAMVAGVGMVHQHFMLVPTLTVAENVLLGAETIPALLRPRKLNQMVQRTAERLGLQVQANALVSALSVGEQQRVEILRVLSRGAKVLILDEPTAVLSPDETEALFASLRRLTEEGCAVVLISHKLEEVRQAASRITVLRKGKVVEHFDEPMRLSAEELASAMVGRGVSLKLDRAPAARAGPALLCLERIRVLSDRGLEAVRGVDLVVRSSEILGLAGVAGNGQLELMEAVAGMRPVLEGTLSLDGQDLGRLSPRARADRGLRFIPEDRHHTGTAPSLSVAENLLLRRYQHPPCRRGPLLDLGALEPFCREKIAELQIATTGLDQHARLLSGGNLQKVILARELTSEGRVILALHPTRGLDAWATTEVRQQLLGARARGAGVLLCSEDLEELLALSDRIAVMTGGRIVLLVESDRADLVAIGRAMATSLTPEARRD